MKRSRFTEEQIIAVLREQEMGAKTPDVCRKHGISEATFYNGVPLGSHHPAQMMRPAACLHRDNARRQPCS
jgi:putative transposase